MLRDYWEEPPDENLPKSYWSDPSPEVTGMLSADVICAYNAPWPEGMINPFDQKNVNAAAYELTLGSYCLVGGEQKLLDEKDPWLEIPSSSVVFVTMRERMRIPHYLV